MNKLTGITSVLLLSLSLFNVGTGFANDAPENTPEETPENTKTEAMFVNADSLPGKTVTAFHQALKAGDATKALSLLDDNVLIFEGGVERSASEYASHHLNADIHFLADVQSTVLDHQVTIAGDLAISIQRSRKVGHYKSRDIDFESFETMSLKRTNDQWKITHIHWSK
ncbi:nuclear transport factor 2 family protein [Paraneptunicella aestuarii]|uniref:YybH family protein n=1 Tax=Paraneptunicella aestuarii TaxID=2831148 RepID=UPI001E458F3A|nr:nuclear transport factor 2 family protein [Paraneptunicella aestuarii]UAA38627.1 nuclear transport factor 2 family protein [Paraneptunicella aestuarii]